MHPLLQPGRRAVLPVLIAGAIAVAGFFATSAEAANAPVPSEITKLGIRNTVLVLATQRPEGTWRVWQGRDARGRVNDFIEVPVGKNKLAGGPCPGLKRRQIVSLCLWGGVGPDFDVTLGRASASARSLSVLSGSTPLATPRSNGVFLAISTSQNRATVIVARNAKGKVIARRKVGSLYAETTN